MKYEPKYWNGKGKYQKKYDTLYPRLVPAMGKSATDHGEILRLVSRIYYDIFNNGGGNITDEREQLAKLVPAYAIESVRKFAKKDATRNFDARAMDSFVDWAILYVEAQELAAPLEKMLKSL